MPGLVGMITRIPKETAEQKIKAMRRTTLYEPFYNYGLHSQNDMYTYVGWTCHRNSFADCMPIFNEARDIILFLAGEVFPDSAQIGELKRKGHEFAENRAGYLVHLYEEEGDRFFEGLNGTFSGLLIDARTRKTVLFNDRFGMHRVFVHRAKEGFYFSSEAKALLSVLPDTRAFDPRGLVELVTCGCTLGGHSLFKGIEVLPGGSLAVFADGELTQSSRYFDRRSWETQKALSDAEFTSQFMELLPRIARKYVSPREPVGISLTGGFDSRMVMATLNPEPGSLPCYSFGSMYRDTFDVKVARQVARECGQTYHVLTLGEDFVSRLPDYLEKAVVISDGYLGLSGAAELYVNSLAREIAPVRLTGNLGSELLRGVRAFKFNGPPPGILHPDLEEYVAETRDTFVRLTEMKKVSFAAFQLAPYLAYGRVAIERSQVIPRSPFLDNDVVGFMYQASETLNGFVLSAAVIGRSRPDLLRIPTDRGFLGTDSTFSKAWRRAYREALFKAEYRVGLGAPDWFVSLSSLLSPLEKNILGRHKYYHERQFIRDYLSEQIWEIVRCEAKSSLSPYLNPKRLAEHMHDHLLGSRNYTAEIDTVMTLAIIGRNQFRHVPANN